ncbi:MAG: acyltransferase domain-containing protein, partial [Deltaproteobacteria bacterium]|nr:acyltransferase domain-containing protein [Deltaproteobacteria bacterium]
MDFNKNGDKLLTPIAIIGVGCLFPKAEGLKEYWRLLYQGIDGITDIPDTHWSPEEYFNQDPKTPDHTYCKRGGFLSPISFDPSEFGIPPTSLEATDTSQILGLVAAKMALDDSGYGENGRSFNRDKTSVILGVTGTQELVIPLSARLGFPKWRKALEESGVSPEKSEEIINKISSSYVGWQENSFPGLLGNVVSGRICNRLDLGGTNCVVDAACASSMSAMHLSLMELASGRSDMVITGGVDTLNDIFMYMCFSKTHTLSPTGDARPFSKDADGTVLGEGVGLLILKRLDESIRDEDKIYSVIKSIGSSSDGKSQSIYAPRIEGQTKALKRAYEFADIDPATVELIEAHGTGTRVGDMTEFKALQHFFNDSNKNTNSCALGSVKSMIGHTKSAAGAAGLIKSSLSLHHKVLPPTLKAQEPDPNLEFDQSPFYLNTDTRPWFSSKDHPRRCGVSAFGFGGSNFHVVLEEYVQSKNEISWDGSVQIFALSAPTKQELIEQMLEHKHFIDNGPTWKDVSNRAAKTRNYFSNKDPYRILLVLEPLTNEQAYLTEELPALFLKATELLETNSTDTCWTLPNAFYGGPEEQGEIAFIFPGQGSQYVNMGKDIVCTFPEALNSISLMDEKFTSAQRLTDIIYPNPAYFKNNKKRCEDTLKETHNAQPAIGAVSLAMLKVLQRFGIKPDAVCGHSFGELTALLGAGWITEETFSNLSIARGDVMANSSKDIGQHRGTMLAVRASLNELADLVETSGLDIVLANKNSPDQGVISGPAESVFKFEEICKQKGYGTVRLSVSAAFHSSLVIDAYEPFLHHLKQAEFNPTNIPVYSNTTGEPYPQDRSKIIKHIAEHILHPVDFVLEIENMFASGVRTFIEVGPKSVLTGMVKSILSGHDIHSISLDTSS